MRRLHGAAVILFLLLPQLCHSDHLFKDEVPIAVGWGPTHGNVIDWRPCESKVETKYGKPPYSVDRGDDCHIRPAALDMTKNPDGTYTIRSLQTFKKHF